MRRGHVTHMRRGSTPLATPPYGTRRRGALRERALVSGPDGMGAAAKRLPAPPPVMPRPPRRG